MLCAVWLPAEKLSCGCILSLTHSLYISIDEYAEGRSRVHRAGKSFTADHFAISIIHLLLRLAFIFMYMRAAKSASPPKAPEYNNFRQTFIPQHLAYNTKNKFNSSLIYFFFFLSRFHDRRETRARVTINKKRRTWRDFLLAGQSGCYTTVPLVAGAGGLRRAIAAYKWEIQHTILYRDTQWK